MSFWSLFSRRTVASEAERGARCAREFLATKPDCDAMLRFWGHSRDCSAYDTDPRSVAFDDAAREVLRPVLFPVLFPESKRGAVRGKPSPPIQPVYRASDGVIRFRDNAIVNWLLDTKRIDLNEIAAQEFPVADKEQFWQMLGYSVSGFGGLSFVRRKTWKRADEWAAQVLASEKKIT